MLTVLLQVRARDWQNFLTLSRSIIEVTVRGGPRSLAKWILDQYFLPKTIVAPVSFSPTSLNLFDDADVFEATGFERERLLWSPQRVSDINDCWSAARFCIDVLRMHPYLRHQFPDALSAGTSGRFARWIETEGANLFSLSVEAIAAIREALSAKLSDYVRQIYLVRDDLQRAFPLAFTPAGRRPFFRWMFEDRLFRLEIIWWFFLETAENPARELVQTFLFRPDWQKMFPDGVTIFGRVKLAKWLTQFYALDGDWLNPSSWPTVSTAAQQIRLAHALRPEWQREHPDPFRTVQSAEAFLQWLSTPASELPADCVAWCSSLDIHAVAGELAAGGVNILGHFCYASGLRRSVESIRESMRRAALSVSVRDIWVDHRDEPRHAEFHGLEYYDATIIHTQPDPYFDVSFARAGLQPRDPRTYRIGYWYWEFEDLPQSWAAQAAQLDEIWVASDFVANAMRQRLDLPVLHLTPGVELPNFRRRPRAEHGLPDDRFIFLFVFSMMSIMERKNPIGLIKAYRQAFGDDARALLVVKTSFGAAHRDLLAELHAAAGGDGVVVVDAVYSPEEILSLLAAADCYVSLHRSEGWGLTMAEAMLLGKPTIATRYSGNMDFMTATNSLLVDYDLVSLKRDYPPYQAGSHWAAPSIEHAAQLMRRVFDDQQWARELGQTAKADLSERLSLAAAGRRMAARLQEIRAGRSDGKTIEHVSRALT